jgi:hypothetical protein
MWEVQARVVEHNLQIHHVAIWSECKYLDHPNTVESVNFKQLCQSNLSKIPRFYVYV